MAKVFICYRRADSASASGRIYDRLVTHFGRENVFKDVDNIPAGVRFADFIHNSLQQCAVELVIIGRNWLTIDSTNGLRRLDDPHDWIRLEIQTGFALGRIVIPVLVEGASLPATSSLPESLWQLSQIQAIEVRHDPDFSHDMDRLIAIVEQAFRSPATPLAAWSGSPIDQVSPELLPVIKDVQTAHPTSSQQLNESAPQPATGQLSNNSSQSVRAMKTSAEQAIPVTGVWNRLRRPFLTGVVLLLVIAALSALLVTRVLGSDLGAKRAATSTPTSHSGWTTIKTSPTPYRMWSVEMVSTDEGWAVGDHGTLLHYTQGQWSLVTGPTLNDLFSIAMVSTDEGWAVGDHGTLLHYTQGQWEPAISPTSNTLWSIAMVSSGEGWIVGERGTILHYTHGQWTHVVSPTSNILYSVSMVSPSQGWAVGAEGAILHLANGQWTRMVSPTSNTLSSVSMVSATAGWAVSDSGSILHYTQGQWEMAVSPTSSTLNCVSMDSATDGWIVGASGMILHYTQGQWEPAISPTSNTLWSIAMVSSGEGWIVGDHGTILHYSAGS